MAFGRNLTDFKENIDDTTKRKSHAIDTHHVQQNSANDNPKPATHNPEFQCQKTIFFGRSILYGTRISNVNRHPKYFLSYYAFV